MDAASGAAIIALDLQPNDNYLEICCAPGSKLCYAADIIGTTGTGTLTGVDISSERMRICKNQMKKFNVERGRLFVCDGTTFDVSAPTRVGKWVSPEVLKQAKKESDSNNVKRKERETLIEPAVKRIRAVYSGRMIREDQQLRKVTVTNTDEISEETDEGFLKYDKVLVDAECTHDGSVVHLLKYAQQGWERALDKGKFLDQDRIQGLEQLQRRLIDNGYRQ
ncbi:hypothetical protein HK096_003720 [Nowakowskiella sp. JEL0078]|nr:hypothetical protein HK096_003720 [Nowakowskiella sp. JEL0078]